MTISVIVIVTFFIKEMPILLPKVNNVDIVDIFYVTGFAIGIVSSNNP